MDVDVALRAIAAIAAAAAVGQVVCRRLPIPLPVFLLAAGVALGESGLNVVRTTDLTDLVGIIVSVAVALIVFEGGTLLNWRLVRVLGPVVRNMVVGGLVVTTVVGMLAAHFALGFGWRLAALFGALVCVTGPSVIIPLLRSVRVNERVRAILMGEAIIIDPLGALLTLFLLQLAVSSSFEPAGPAFWVVKQVVVGVAVGAAGAALVVVTPRVVRRLSGREISLLVTAAAVTAFAVAQSISSDAGLTAMVVMGIALGNLPLPHRESMGEFQESIVAFLVASVYVLLAASVRVQSVLDLWPAGFIVVAVLILIGRPLLIAVATARSDLSWRERAFLAAVAPRGVVAASLAGVVALEATQRLGADESEFVAMVFVVLAVT
ncbi:MAG: cation:proton antiporter, partial [Tepidiformaceae bacterium]